MGLFDFFRQNNANSFTHLSDLWDSAYFDTDAFYLRLHRALCYLPQYSYRLSGGNSMQIYSENEKLTYHCSLKRCDCEDFRKKQKPCKHMIFLDIRLNGLEAFLLHTYGFSSADLYTVSSYRGTYDILSCFAGDKSSDRVNCTPRTASLNYLIRSGYLIETFCDAELLNKFSRSELSALIRISGQKPTGTKDQLISWITENCPPIIQYCRLHYVFWRICDNYAALFHFLSRYFHINEYFPDIRSYLPNQV